MKLMKKEIWAFVCILHRGTCVETSVQKPGAYWLGIMCSVSVSETEGVEDFSCFTQMNWTGY